GMDAFRAHDVQHTVALQTRTVIGVGDEIAGGVKRIVKRNDLPGSIRIPPEVPIAEVLDRQGDQILFLNVLKSRTLAGEEEEGLIAAVVYLGDINRASQGRGKKILALDAVPVGTVEESIRVQVLVAMLREECAVQIIGARFGGVIQDAVGRAAELRRISAA